MKDPVEAGFITIAEVNRVRGIRGEVVATIHADDPSRMAQLGSVFIRDPDGSYQRLGIEGVKRLGPRAVLKLSGFDTPEQARSLVGRELFIPPEASTPAPPGRYYAYQLAGLSAQLKDGTPLGRVREVLSQGGQSLLVIEGKTGEILVPFVKAICIACDLSAGTVTLDPPEGLIELNETARTT